VIPEHIGSINTIRAYDDRIFIHDRSSIFEFKDGDFITVFTPPKGDGPGEINQIYRFDIIPDSLIAIAGYPDARVLIHDLVKDTSIVITTLYRGNVLILDSGRVMAENSNHESEKMFTVFNLSDEFREESFGTYFKNQMLSLNGFDFVWSIDRVSHRIAIGFRYVGYHILLDAQSFDYHLIESMQDPGRLPALVTRSDMTYIDSDGPDLVYDVSIFENELHVFSTYITNDHKELYGTIIDVMNANTGTYSYSYILDRPLRYSFSVVNDSTIVGLTEDFELAIWKRVH
jgi:hypothetical protein